MPKLTTEQLRELYPVAQVYTPLGGYDIQRTSRRITALVVVEDERGGRDLRFYSWLKKRTGQQDGDDESESGKAGYRWKVDLARNSVVHWNLRELAIQGNRLAKKYNVKMDDF
ncbi:MAG: hypothetical protein HYT71_02315 [Candidatus Aenigmarchaeota archaeon]|nr:hypothetical protein [Candidatus Aenigmarchaeota archaeon]